MAQKISDKDCEKIADGIVNNIYPKKWLITEKWINYILLIQIAVTLVILGVCTYLVLYILDLIK
jgi:hypothetical protein